MYKKGKKMVRKSAYKDPKLKFKTLKNQGKLKMKKTCRAKKAQGTLDQAVCDFIVTQILTRMQKC